MAKCFTFQFRKQTYLISLKLGFLLFCVFFFTLFCVLGVWQLHRYHFKKDLLVNYSHRLVAEPRPFNDVVQDTKNLQFEKVKVEGKYLSNLTLFMQNQLYQEKMGYEVFTPLQLPGQKKLLLVDRGWIAKPPTQVLPEIGNVVELQKIIGYLKVVNEYQFILGPNILTSSNSAGRFYVIQKIDTDEISKLTHLEFYPFVLRLDAKQANGFVRDWVISSVMPERHMGYAIQWFLMAFVLFIAYLCFCCERIKN